MTGAAGIREARALLCKARGNQRTAESVEAWHVDEGAAALALERLESYGLDARHEDSCARLAAWESGK